MTNKIYLVECSWDGYEYSTITACRTRGKALRYIQKRRYDEYVSFLFWRGREEKKVKGASPSDHDSNYYYVKEVNIYD